ncbi:unnamed protein product [Penicillium olsonii]|uniref:Uncharacterized protein n=1 Tax=Penicillium olsonii TaxID=99116 RepID=A0A9W4HKK8_PENOL|nr:unnamed protein product [Penicillium olsonii]CAG7932027.1 unnamed protein product [Penicillium olsonii]CAG8045563.1 unnamed protein product [Penicillium olsonii]CAG8206472.1 unnamed protein product [Penicillium olsonii]
MNVDHRMLRHGSQLYNNAVGHMSHALSRQFYTDELLYTAIIFQELEAIYCPNNLGAFVMHVVGISSILKRYRPQILAAPLTAAIYHKHHKLKVFITNFLSLSDDDYEYLSQPALGDPLLELFQIMADIGLLYKKGGSIFVSNDGSCQEFLSNCLVLQEKQMAWYHRWEGRIGWKESTYGPGKESPSCRPFSQRNGSYSPYLPSR